MNRKSVNIFSLNRKLIKLLEIIELIFKYGKENYVR
jgi:hypothetical protein